jgi:hypothetical protein
MFKLKKIALFRINSVGLKLIDSSFAALFFYHLRHLRPVNYPQNRQSWICD